MLLRKIINNIIFKHKHPVIVNSIPKSGTNLLLNIIRKIPKTRLRGDFSLAGSYDEKERLKFIQSVINELNPGDIYSGHIPYFKEYADWLINNNVKQIFIYRDPRDVTVSLYHYIINKKPKHAYYELMNQYPNNSQRLLAAINGIGKGQEKFELNNQSIPNIGISFAAYANWLNDKNTLSVSYEDLVDESIGIDFVRRVVSFLEIKNIYSTFNAKDIWSEGKNPSLAHTFRKGTSGSWKDEYQREHLEAFSKVFNNEILERYGYNI